MYNLNSVNTEYLTNCGLYCLFLKMAILFFYFLTTYYPDMLQYNVKQQSVLQLGIWELFLKLSCVLIE